MKYSENDWGMFISRKNSKGMQGRHRDYEDNEKKSGISMEIMQRKAL